MKAIKIHTDDNVATLIGKVEKGENVSIFSAEGKVVGTVTASSAIPLGHKLSVEEIGMDADVVKFGEVIGKAVQVIEKGMHVHVHNVESRRVR